MSGKWKGLLFNLLKYDLENDASSPNKGKKRIGRRGGRGGLAYMQQFDMQRVDSLIIGDEAQKYRENHEKSGVLIFRSVLVVITIGFITNSGIGFASGEGYYSLFPSSLHGWFGIMGLILLTILVNSGKTVKALRESSKAFGFELQRHGRASDLVMILLVLHAFIGFIYLFQLLVL